MASESAVQLFVLFERGSEGVPEACVECWIVFCRFASQFVSGQAEFIGDWRDKRTEFLGKLDRIPTHGVTPCGCRSV